MEGSWQHRVVGCRSFLMRLMNLNRATYSHLACFPSLKEAHQIQPVSNFSNFSLATGLLFFWSGIISVAMRVTAQVPTSPFHSVSRRLVTISLFTSTLPACFQLYKPLVLISTNGKILLRVNRVPSKTRLQTPLEYMLFCHWKVFKKI